MSIRQTTRSDAGDTAQAVDIKPVAESDLGLLERRFPEGGTAKHTRNFLCQQKGEAVYLIAWLGDQPVAHAFLKWGGSKDEAVSRSLSFACPDIEDLFVLAEFRSQGIGTQILAHAERQVRERGYAHIGLSVGIENDPAHRLYERLGYHDAHCGEYLERAEWLDDQGQLRVWEETCMYMVKDLR